MMIRIFIGIILLSFSLALKAQNSLSKIFFEVGYSQQNVKMENLNRYFIDSFAFKINDLSSHIEKGQNIYIKFKIRPKSFFDIGVFIETQSSKVTSKPILKTLDEDLNLIMTEGLYSLAIRSTNIGIANTWYLNQILRFNRENKFLDRLDFGLDALLGIGLPYVVSEFHNTAVKPISISQSKWYSKDLFGKIGISLEYYFLKKTIFSSLGLKAGYQFYKTKTLTNRLGRNWEAPEYAVYKPINLDFSGLYYGIYLKIGK